MNREVLPWIRAIEVVKASFCDTAVKGLSIVYIGGDLKVTVTVENAMGMDVKYTLKGELDSPVWQVHT